MARRPVIGIATPAERARWAVWDLDAAVVALNYIRAVQDAGGLAVLLPPDPATPERPDEALDLIDGLLLIGGPDLDAGAYGAAPHPEAEQPAAERDAAEIALAAAARRRGMPVLGICRGLQVLNVAAGGDLTQHLPEALGHEEHRRNLGSFTGNDHVVDLTPGSRAAAAAGGTETTVVSHHHQAVGRPGDRLFVTGRSDDGVVEAIEPPPDDPWMLGVQWHPEADAESAVIGALVRAATDAREGRPDS